MLSWQVLGIPTLKVCTFASTVSKPHNIYVDAIRRIKSRIRHAAIVPPPLWVTLLILRQDASGVGYGYEASQPAAEKPESVALTAMA